MILCIVVDLKFYYERRNEIRVLQSGYCCLLVSDVQLDNFQREQVSRATYFEKIF